MLKLERLMYAMAETEGWAPPGKSKAVGGSASFRRNNPGNLRASPFAVGSENGFAVFNTDQDGFAALKWDLIQKSAGNTSTGLSGKSTLEDLIHVWAPASDGNDPAGYLQSVLTKTGFPATMRLAELL